MAAAMSVICGCMTFVRRRRDTNPERKSSDESEQSHEMAVISPSSPSTPAEAAGAAALLANRTTSQSWSRQAQLLSNSRREERHIRWKGQDTETASRDAEVEDEADKELRELARDRERALLFLSSPEGREPDREGYVTQQQYNFSRVQINDYWMKYVPIVTYRQVKIDTLPDVDQNCVYEYTLCQATIQQVRQQYEIHYQRLETLRRNMLIIRNVSKKERRPGNIEYVTWCYISSQLQLGQIAPIAQRAARAYEEAQIHYDVRLEGRIAVRGVIRLLERCESILKEFDANFVPKDWRSALSAFRKRWADGERGWTGLEQRDID